VDDHTERDWLDRTDRWCVNCKRNVGAQKAGVTPLMMVVATALLIVLGGLIGLGVAVLTDASPPTLNADALLAVGAGLGLLVAIVAVGGDDHRCAICKSKNLKDPR
jgi:hypothetical protein